VRYSTLAVQPRQGGGRGKAEIEKSEIRKSAAKNLNREIREIHEPGDQPQKNAENAETEDGGQKLKS
jgi:hypothetical protein